MSVDNRIQEILSGKHSGYQKIMARKLLGVQGRMTKEEAADSILDICIDAAYAFDPNRNVKWSTFLRSYLHWQTCSLIKRKIRRPELQAVTSVGSCDEIQAESHDRDFVRHDIQDAVQSLSKSSRAIFSALLRNQVSVKRKKGLGCNAISTLTGYPVRECRRFVSEVRKNKSLREICHESD